MSVLTPAEVSVSVALRFALVLLPVYLTLILCNPLLKEVESGVIHSADEESVAPSW